MKRTDVVAIGLIILATACSPSEAKHDTAADMAAITKVRTGWETAFKAGDAAAIGALYTADAHLMNNEMATATGPKAIEAMYKEMIGTMASQAVVITAEQTDVSGDLAVDRGTYKLSLSPKGGAAMTEEGRYMVVLKRQADGSWKLFEDIGNITAPRPAAPAAPPAKKN
jgi:uncharacterized protein (TIGR02246 family)